MASPVLNDKDFVKPEWDKDPPYFPSTLINPELKLTKEYCLSSAKAIYWNNWNTFQNAYGNTMRTRYIDNRAWSQGQFDVTPFVGGRKFAGNQSKNPLLKHIDFDPVTDQSKYRDIVVGFMEDLDFEITATTLNPIGAAIKENQRISEMALLQMKNSGFSQQIDQAAGMPIMPQSELNFPVNTEQELNAYYDLGGFKEDAEIEIETANSIVNNDSDWKEISKMLLEDAFDCGCMITDTIYEKDGRIRKKYVDPVNCGVEDYRGHGLKRPGRIWYIELKTVQTILMEAEGQLSMDDMVLICQKFESKFGNPVWNAAYQGWQSYVNTDSTYAYSFYNWKVPVMKTYWEEMDLYKVAKETYNDGYEIKRWAGYEEQSQKFENTEPMRGETNPQSNSGPVIIQKDIEQMQYHRYYQCTWIVNTQLCYDYGRVPFQARDPYNPRYSLCPMKYYRITNQPMAERIKPYAKRIYMTIGKIDNEIAHKAPSGFEFNMNALENITLGSGETFTIKHNFQMLQETGNMLAKPKAVGDLYGQNREEWTVRPIPQGGFFDAIRGYAMYINLMEDRIIKLTGINDMMDGSNPNPDIPATAVKLAAQGSKNSLSQIAAALLYMNEKSALDVCDRVRLVVEATGDDYGGYGDAIGYGLLSLTGRKVTKQVISHRFGIKVMAKPTLKERERMKEYVQQAFANMASPEQGGLWATDAWQFEEDINAGVSLKLIRLKMISVIRERLNFLQKQRMEMIDRQVRGNMQTQADATKQALTMEQEATRLRMIEAAFNADQTIRINNANNSSKTGNAMVKDVQKSHLKMNEEIVKSTLDR